MYLLLSLSLTVLSAPPAADAELDRPRPELKYHRRPVRRGTIRFGRAFELEGILEEEEDGQWSLRQTLRDSTRRKMAEARQKPLRSVPRQVQRRFLVAPGGPDQESLELQVGRRVRAILRQDPTGQTFLIKLETPPAAP